MLFKAGAEEYVAIFAMKGVNMKQASFMNEKQLSEVKPIYLNNTFMFIILLVLNLSFNMVSRFFFSWEFTMLIYDSE